MTSVEQLIGNLLLRHNCVIIPSFGGFVAQRISARIDYKSGTMLPPGKSILFNRQLLNNDGLLVNEFARENNVSFDEASKELDALVEQWNVTLTQGGRIEIERVGNLFFDEERNICFEQDRFANLLLESFGLGSVHFVSEEDVRIVEHKISVEETVTPVKEEKTEIAPVIPAKEEAAPVQKVVAEEKSSAVEEKEVVTPIIPIQKAKPIAKETKVVPQENVAAPKSRNRAWRYVAAACILPIAFYSIWIPARTDILESGMISFSDFNPFHKRQEATYKPEKETTEKHTENTKETSLSEEIAELSEGNKVYMYKFASDTYIAVTVPEKEADPSTEVVEDPVEIPNNESNESFNANTMHYVVGCFGDKTNADNLVARLKANGLDAMIVDVKGGLHRVSAGGAISEESYQTIKLKADAMGLSGWRLR